MVIRKKIHVRISNVADIVWEGEAKSISSENSDGPFDILPMHSNFITLVKNKPIIVRQLDGVKKKYSFRQSVIFVNNNMVKIFAEIA